MRVSHYLILVAFLCGAAGLLLEKQVLDGHDRLDHGRSSLEANTLLGRDVSRIADNVRTLLTVTDLVFGAQESYLIDGALRQKRELELLLQQAHQQVTALNSTGKGSLVELTRKVAQLGRELERYAVLEEAPGPTQQSEILDTVDRIAADLVEAVHRLQQYVQEEQQAAQAALATEKRSADLLTRFALVGYVLFVLLVLVWSARRVGAPIRRLEALAAKASGKSEDFDPPEQGPVEVRALTRNITKLVHSLQQELKRSQAITEAIPDALVVADLEQGITYFKPADESKDGIGSDDLAQWRFLSLLNVEEISRIERHMQRCVRTNQSQQFTISLPSPGGERSLEARASPCGDGRVVVVLRDLTEKLDAERRIQRLAYFDSLTGLLNRASATQQIADHIAKAETASQPFALAFIDVDRFKRFNDTEGHEFGDKILVHIAKSICSCIRFDQNRPFAMGRESDLPARIGGDEFMLMLRGIETERAAQAVVQRLLAAISKPIEIDGQRVEIGVSIGVSLYPRNADSLPELHFQSDMAMYEAKRAGGSDGRIYSEHMGDRTRARLSMEARLKNALEQDSFFLEYQPQLEFANRAIVGVEALLRWEDEGVLIPPGEFIPIAEECGLIVPIGEVVTRKAAQQASTWRFQGVHFGRIHINVSADQFSQPEFTQLLVDTLAQHAVPLSNFGVEVTETVVVQDFERATNVLSRLREMGVLISMDDFGTGYSSLNYLKHLPLDVLKIDRSFLRDLDIDSKEVALIRTIVQLGHELNMHVLAEGVETSAQFEMLRDAKCDQAQGYLISRPLRADAYVEFVTGRMAVESSTQKVHPLRA